MSERAWSVSTQLQRSTEVDAQALDIQPVQRRTAIGTGPMPTLPSVLAPSSALPIQMFADAVGAGIHARVVQLDGTGGGLSANDVHRAAAHGLSGSGGALPHLTAIQRSFGRHDVSGVTAHVGGRAAEGSAAMGARAYASGNEVAFASSPDLHLAAHEAAHVVQQRGGVQLSGGVGAAGDAYEVHADAVAETVVRGESAEALLDQFAPAGGSSAGVQRAIQRWATEPDEAVVNRQIIQAMIASANPAESTELVAALSAPVESFGGVALVRLPGADRSIPVADLDLAPLIAEAERHVAPTSPAPETARGRGRGRGTTPAAPASTATATCGGTSAERDLAADLAAQEAAERALEARHAAESLADVERALSGRSTIAERRAVRDALRAASTPRSDGNHHLVIGIRNIILRPADYTRALAMADSAVAELEGPPAEEAAEPNPYTLGLPAAREPAAPAAPELCVSPEGEAGEVAALRQQVRDRMNSCSALFHVAADALKAELRAAASADQKMTELAFAAVFYCVAPGLARMLAGAPSRAMLARVAAGGTDGAAAAASVARLQSRASSIARGLGTIGKAAASAISHAAPADSSETEFVEMMQHGFEVGQVQIMDHLNCMSGEDLMVPWCNYESILEQGPSAYREELDALLARFRSQVEPLGRGPGFGSDSMTYESHIAIVRHEGARYVARVGHNSGSVYVLYAWIDADMAEMAAARVDEAPLEIDSSVLTRFRAPSSTTATADVIGAD